MLTTLTLGMNTLTLSVLTKRCDLHSYLWQASARSYGHHDAYTLILLCNCTLLSHPKSLEVNYNFPWAIERITGTGCEPCAHAQQVKDVVVGTKSPVWAI